MPKQSGSNDYDDSGQPEQQTSPPETPLTEDTQNPVSGAPPQSFWERLIAMGFKIDEGPGAEIFVGGVPSPPKKQRPN